MEKISRANFLLDQKTTDTVKNLPNILPLHAPQRIHDKNIDHSEGSWNTPTVEWARISFTDNQLCVMLNLNYKPVLYSCQTAVAEKVLYVI